jgi:hypothetical protein
MRSEQHHRVRRLAWGVLGLLACLIPMTPARADGPVLTLRLVGGAAALYPVSDIQRIDFAGDTLVVVRADGSDRYAAATIVKIEFLPESSGTKDPRNAAALMKAAHLFQNRPSPFSPETRLPFVADVGFRTARTLTTAASR